MMHADVAVIGGGIHGCAAALNLARRGLKVAVFEKETVGRHASGVNAGGVRTLLRHDAEISLALESRKIWHSIEEEVGDDCRYHTVGQVAVAENEAALEHLSSRASRLGELGYFHEELIDAASLREMVPTIAPSVLGALVARDDGAASPYHATMAFRAAALREGVVIRERCPVIGLSRDGEGWHVASADESLKASAVVNAAGAWGDVVAGWVGDDVPLGCMLPMMMVTARVPHFLDPVIVNTARPLSFKQMPNGTLLIGGGRPAIGSRDGGGYKPDFCGLMASAATVRDLFPHLRDVLVVRAWAGIEGRFDDDIPLIGPSSSAPGIVHAFGFCGHGFQLAPIVGRLIAELIIDGRASHPIDAFSPDRFAKAEAA